MSVGKPAATSCVPLEAESSTPAPAISKLWLVAVVVLVVILAGIFVLRAFRSSQAKLAVSDARQAPAPSNVTAAGPYARDFVYWKVGNPDLEGLKRAEHDHWAATLGKSWIVIPERSYDEVVAMAGTPWAVSEHHVIPAVEGGCPGRVENLTVRDYWVSKPETEPELTVQFEGDLYKVIGPDSDRACQQFDYQGRKFTDVRYLWRDTGGGIKAWIKRDEALADPRYKVPGQIDRADESLQKGIQDLRDFEKQQADEEEKRRLRRERVKAARTSVP